MFNDVNSVRSDPLGPYNSSVRVNRNSRSNYYFDNRDDYVSASRVQNQNQNQRWRDLLLPEIDQKYN